MVWNDVGVRASHVVADGGCICVTGLHDCWCLSAFCKEADKKCVTRKDKAWGVTLLNYFFYLCKPSYTEDTFGTAKNRATAPEPEWSLS